MSETRKEQIASAVATLLETIRHVEAGEWEQAQSSSFPAREIIRDVVNERRTERERMGARP
jgi:hypothetical protein